MLRVIENQCISSVFQIQFARPFCAIAKPEAILRNNTMQCSESSSDWISLGQEEVSTWATCPFKGSSVCMSLAWLTACLSLYERCPLVEVQLYFLLPEDNYCYFFLIFLGISFGVKTIFSKNSRDIYFLLTSFIDFPTIFYANLFLTPNLFCSIKIKFDTVNSVLGYRSV